jgi:hypothetical protein
MFVISMSNRQFRITSTKLMGTFSPATQSGDKICIPYGGTVPYVIRPIGDETYRFVGECHAHGIMKGEGLKLGLPDPEFVFMTPTETASMEVQ